MQEAEYVYQVNVTEQKNSGSKYFDCFCNIEDVLKGSAPEDEKIVVSFPLKHNEIQAEVGKSYIVALNKEEESSLYCMSSRHSVYEISSSEEIKSILSLQQGENDL